MALKLSNVFECRTWDEWSNRINSFNVYKIRKEFYPHQMDKFELIMKKLEFHQRESVKAVIDQRDNLPQYWFHITEKENNLWKEQTNVLKSKILSKENFESTLDEILILEKKRLYDLVSSVEPRIRRAEEEEAAEDLLLLSKIAHQEAHQKRKIEQRKRENQKNESLIRRSRRLLEKYN